MPGRKNDKVQRWKFLNKKSGVKIKKYYHFYAILSRWFLKFFEKMKFSKKKLFFEKFKKLRKKLVGIYFFGPVCRESPNLALCKVWTFCIRTRIFWQTFNIVPKHASITTTHISMTPLVHHTRHTPIENYLNHPRKSCAYTGLSCTRFTRPWFGCIHTRTLSTPQPPQKRAK